MAETFSLPFVSLTHGQDGITVGHAVHAAHAVHATTVIPHSVHLDVLS